MVIHTEDKGIKIAIFFVVVESLYTEVSSFQGVGIKEFHCIQRFCWNRVVPLYTELGVLISGGWNRGVLV